MQFAVLRTYRYASKSYGLYGYGFVEFRNSCFMQNIRAFRLSLRIRLLRICSLEARSRWCNPGVYGIHYTVTM